MAFDSTLLSVYFMCHYICINFELKKLNLQSISKLNSKYNYLLHVISYTCFPPLEFLLHAYNSELT